MKGWVGVSVLAACLLYNAEHAAGPHASFVAKSANAAENVPVARGVRTGQGGAVRIDFRAVALREARLAGIKSPRLFVRQIAQESQFDPCVGSSAGAKGISQLMDSTGKSWGVTDPYDPYASLRAAAKAMAVYERQLGSYRLATAAYNAGPGAVSQYNGFPPYPETVEYARRILGDYPLPGLKRVYTRPGGYTPEFRKRLGRFLRAGKGQFSVVPGNGFRTVQQQGVLWEEAKKKYGGWQNARRFVAPKFCSGHSKGEAVDLRGDLALAKQLAPKYGIRSRVPGEPWHFSLTGY